MVRGTQAWFGCGDGGSDKVSAFLFDPADHPLSVGVNFAGSEMTTQLAEFDIGGKPMQAYWNNLPSEGKGTVSGDKSNLIDSWGRSTSIAGSYSSIFS